MDSHLILLSALSIRRPPSASLPPIGPGLLLVQTFKCTAQGLSDRDGSPAAGRKCANGSAANRKLSSVGHPFLWPLTVSFDLLGLILSSLDFFEKWETREPPISFF